MTILKLIGKILFAVILWAGTGYITGSIVLTLLALVIGCWVIVNV